MQRIGDATVPLVIVYKKVPPPSYLKDVITGLSADKQDADRFLEKSRHTPAERVKAQGLLVRDDRTVIIPASNIDRIDFIEVPLPSKPPVRAAILGVDLATHTVVLRLQSPLARSPLMLSTAPPFNPGDSVRGVSVSQDRIEAARRTNTAKPRRYGLVPVADYKLVTAHILKTEATIDDAVQEVVAVDRVLLPYTPVVDSDDGLRGVVVAQLLDGGNHRWDGFSFLVEGWRLEDAIARVKDRLAPLHDMLGLIARTDIDPIAKSAGFSGETIIQVVNTRPGSAARAAGIPAGALVSKIDGTPFSARDVVQSLRGKSSGQRKVTLTYIYGINKTPHDVTVPISTVR